MKGKMRIIGCLSIVLLVCVLIGQGIWLHKVRNLEMKRFEQEVSSLLRVSFDEYLDKTSMVPENRFAYSIRQDGRTFVYGGLDTVKEMVLPSVEQFHEMGKAVFYDYLFEKEHLNVLELDSLYRHNLKNADIEKLPVIIVRDSVGQILMSSAISKNLVGKIRTRPIDVGYAYRHRIEAVFDLPFIFRAMIWHLVVESIFLLAFIGCLVWLWRAIRLTWQSAVVQTMGMAHLEHELRKPLAAMISALGSMRNEKLTESQERRLMLMEARVKRIAEVTDTMLITLKSSCLTIERTPVDVSREMAEIEEMFRALRPHASLEFEVESGIGEPRLDKVYFGYLVINLVDNAIKYGGNEPWVKVRFYKEGEEWVLTVADHGIGMQTKELRRIFRQFYRVKDKRVAGKTGFGLGLAFVRKVVEAYGGEIRVESTPGKGSKFEIRINKSMENIKVLCAEDDELMRLEIKEKMTKKGWEVIEAADGEEALKKYEEFQPDFIILDVDMPKRTGIEVVELIRVNDLKTPIVIYSSLGGEERSKDALECGVLVYAVKDFSVDWLVTQVECLMRREKALNLTLAKGVAYDFNESELWIGGQRKELSGLENRVFDILCKNKNKLSPRDVLLKAGWDKTDNNLESQLNKVIWRLRILLSETDQVEIILDKGKGYWLKTQNGK